ncbi:hypothetical protein GMES_3598 [Paraglaciecola mesophila KMM 241]|uniref:Uncharacterized protein n=1 Tax=Paraglaciecola mesophila KMM 241 TaxID=1128912 RepID=K6ZRG0_9ALTE|nr:hypothetical protein GMES_3598 [Paraglaciecola mesophila KMM 241]
MFFKRETIKALKATNAQLPTLLPLSRILSVHFLFLLSLF